MTLTNIKSFITRYKILFGVLLVILTPYVFYHVYYSDKIIPGVKVGSVDLSALTYNQAKQKLTESVEKANKNLALKYSDKEYTISPEEISLEYKINPTIARAFEVGRTNNFYVDNRDKIAGLIKTLQLKLYYDFDDAALSNKVLAIRSEIDKPESDAKFILGDKTLTISNSENGFVADGQELNKAVINSFDMLQFDTIEVPMEVTTPNITEDHLRSLQHQVTKIVFKGFSLKNKDKTWSLTPEQTLALIDIVVNKDTNFAPEIRVDKSNFAELTSTLGLEISTLPKAQVTELKDNKVLGLKLLSEGTEIDEEAFLKDLRANLLSDSTSVDIPTKTIDANKDISKYGIKELLATGISKYTGSAASRVHNLALAAERAGNTLVAPGAIYSLNKTIGEISGKTGYDSAYIITNGRTVLGEGGGVCQTSTTLFRAALNAGLPIVARYAHAYRVKYYEIESPVGIDAAIFQPSLDFQFKNDTSSYILVESTIDKDKDLLTFNIYGTSDGRKVEMTEPVITSQTPPPPAQYIDDPTIPEGVIRQVDFPAWGANVTFSRTVTRDGETLANDTFNSRYQAWKAVFLKGTKK